jgi:hypothetical protein
LGDVVDKDELDAPTDGWKIDVTIGIPQISLMVWIYNPA